MTADSKPKPKRDRSPPYPFISLKKALVRIEEFAAAFDKHDAYVPLAAKTWKYGQKSSGALQTIATLKSYGLISDTGAGKDRKIRLTDLAHTILRDKRPGARETAIKQAAFGPDKLREYHSIWGPRRPPDDQCISEMTLDKGFTHDGSKRFLTVYDETMSLLGESDRDNIPEEDQNPADTQPERRPPGAGMDRASWSVDEGEAVINWPKKLSPASAAELKGWLKLIIDKFELQATRTKAED